MITSSTISTRPPSAAPTIDAAFAVILGFLAIEAERQIVPLFGEGDRRRRRQGDPLVRRSEQLVAGHARSQQRLGIEPAEPPQALAVVEQSRVEEVRRPASRLGHELPETQHVACQRKGEEFLAKIGQWQARVTECAAIIRRPPGAAGRARAAAGRVRRSQNSRAACKLAAFRSPGPRLAAPTTCASSPSTSTASARPSGGASRAGSPAPSPGTSSACRRSRRRTTTFRARSGRRAGRTRRSFRRERKGYSGVALYAKTPPRFAAGFGSREFDAEGRYLEAHFAGADRRQRLPAVGLERAAPAGVEVPLPRRVPAAPRAAAQDAGARSSSAATGTSRTSRSTSRTGAATRRTRASCPRSARGSRGSSTSWASSTSSAASTRGPTSTPGGRIAGRRGRRTSAGGSTTRSPRPASRRRRGRRRSTRTGASPTTRRSSSTTTTSCGEAGSASCCASPTSSSPAARSACSTAPSLTVHAGHKVGLDRAERLRQVEPVRAAPRRAAPGRRRASSCRPAWTIAHVAQETPAVAAPAIEFVLDGDRELREVERALAAPRGRGAAIRTRGRGAGAAASPLRRRSAATRRAPAPRRCSPGSAFRPRATATRSRASPAAGGCGSISRRR